MSDASQPYRVVSSPLQFRGDQIIESTDVDAVPYGEIAELPRFESFDAGRDAPDRSPPRRKVRVVRRPPGLVALLISSAVAAALTIAGLSAVSTFVPEWIVDRAVGAIRTAQARAPSRAQPSPRRGSIYVVQPGDSLSLIAARTLGDARKWPRLLEMNRAIIHNAADLEVGMQLRLPGR